MRIEGLQARLAADKVIIGQLMLSILIAAFAVIFRCRTKMVGGGGGVQSVTPLHQLYRSNPHSSSATRAAAL